MPGFFEPVPVMAAAIKLVAGTHLGAWCAG